MSDYGIIVKYVFNGTEYDTLEAAKTAAKTTGGIVYRRQKGKDLNQVKHWKYSFEKPTYEDLEYNITPDSEECRVEKEESPVPANSYLFKVDLSSEIKITAEG